MSNVKISTRSVGQNFGTCAVVTDAASGREIHTTDARPFGFSAAAIDDAELWAARHHHETLAMAVARRVAHAAKHTPGRPGATLAGLESDGWSSQAIGWAIKTGELVKLYDGTISIPALETRASQA